LRLVERSPPGAVIARQGRSRGTLAIGGVIEQVTDEDRIEGLHGRFLLCRG
jgi:hypothetical protein